MSQSIRLLPEPLRSIGFGSIGAAYMGIGTAIDNKARLVYISNLTNTTMMISFDGVNDHLPLAVYGFLLLDVCYNKTSSSFYTMSVGDRVYVKEIIPPKTGSVYVTVFYGKDE